MGTGINWKRRYLKAEGPLGQKPSHHAATGVPLTMESGIGTPVVVWGTTYEQPDAADLFVVFNTFLLKPRKMAYSC